MTGGIALLPAHVCGDDLAAGRLLRCCRISWFR